MKSRIRFATVSFAVAGALVLSLAGVGYAYRPPSAEQTVTEWLAVKSNVRPTTLTSIVEQPTYLQRAFIRRMTATEKAAMWREHLNAFVLPVVELNEAQRLTRAAIPAPLTDVQVAHIKKAIATIDQLFDEKVDLATRQKIADSLCGDSTAGFTLGQKRALFASITPVDSAEVNAANTFKREAAKPKTIAAGIFVPTGQLMGLMKIGAARLAGKPVLPTAECNCQLGSGCNVCVKPCVSCANPNNYVDCGCFMMHACSGFCGDET